MMLREKESLAPPPPPLRGRPRRTQTDPASSPVAPVRRCVSESSLGGLELLHAALRSAFGSSAPSSSLWPADRFDVRGPTRDVHRAAAQMAKKAGDVVVVCRNEFAARPPRQLRKLKRVVRRSASAILDEPNAGGSSDQSEAVSLATLKVLFDASLVSTEMAVEYDASFGCKKIDYLAAVEGKTRLGVSVTRAYRHRGTFDAADARRLLCKKLVGLWVARRKVAKSHAFELGLLHVWCESTDASALLADVIQRDFRQLWPLRLFELAGMPAPIVMLTSCKHVDHIIFRNKDDWREDDDAAAARSSSCQKTKDAFHAEQRRALAKLRRATYSSLVPERFRPPKEPDRLAYFR